MVVELIECWISRQSAYALNATNLPQNLLLPPIFHVWTTQPDFGFGCSGVPEFGFLEYFPEFCHEEGIWGHIDVYQAVEYFLEAWD